MNILYFWAEENNNMSQWQRIHIFDELEKEGHTIEVFNPLNFNSNDHANLSIKKDFQKRKSMPDLFMSCMSSDYLFRDTIELIKKMGIPTLLICFDNLHVPFIHKKTAPLFDLVWLTSIETQYLFKKWGCNTIFLPYAANPYKFKSSFKHEIPAIGFIGSLYGARLNKIRFLADNNIKCNVYSNKVNSTNNKYDASTVNFFYELLKFPVGRSVLKGAIKNKLQLNFPSKLIDDKKINYYPSVVFEDMIQLYSNLNLSLGVTELRNTYLLSKPLFKLHLRTFEIPMSGGLQITSYTDELANYFEDDKEIILYKNNEEFLDKTKFYMSKKNSKIRLEMKTNARKRAIGEHTWFNRFNKVFSSI